MAPGWINCWVVDWLDRGCLAEIEKCYGARNVNSILMGLKGEVKWCWSIVLCYWRTIWSEGEEVEPRNSFYFAGWSGGSWTYHVHFVLIFPLGSLPLAERHEEVGGRWLRYLLFLLSLEPLALFRFHLSFSRSFPALFVRRKMVRNIGCLNKIWTVCQYICSDYSLLCKLLLTHLKFNAIYIEQILYFRIIFK